MKKIYLIIIISFTLIHYCGAQKVLFGVNDLVSTGAGGNLFITDSTGSTTNELLNMNYVGADQPGFQANAMTRMCKANNGKYYIPVVHYKFGSMYSARIYEYDPDGNNLIYRYMYNQANIGASSLVKGFDGKLYGTTEYGGIGYGAVYQFDPVTLQYTNRFSFNGSLSFPISPLLMASDGYAYGTTSSVLYQFNLTTGAVVGKCGINLNMNYFSGGSLVEIGGYLYGIYDENIFRVSLTNFTIQVIYGGGSDLPLGAKTLATDGVNLFGTTSGTGPDGLGGIFEYDIAGDSLVEHYYFNGTDGKNLYSGLSYLSDGKFYGITKEGGTNSRGVIFCFDPVSNTYTKTHDQTTAESLGSTGFLVEDVFAGPGSALVDNDTVCNAATAIFKYKTGGRFVTYQWQENQGTGWNNLNEDLNYVGTNSDSLRVQNVNNNMNGFIYRCIIDGIYAGADTSNIAALYLHPTYVNLLNTDLSPPYQNGDTIMLMADSVSYLNYQWYRFGSPITGATASTFMATQSGIYNLTVANSMGCIYNTPFIHLNIILADPLNASVCSGDTAKFKITRDGPYYYSSPSWQVNNGVSGWIDIGWPNGLNDSLILTGVDTSMNGYQFRCIVTSVYSDQDTSDVVLLNVVPGCYTWPGDTDNNNFVSNYDLLPIGLYYGQTGSARSVQSNAWQNWPASDWGILQSSGSDMKHVDCNGDGIINNSDTLAVILNYNLAHATPVYTAVEERFTGPPVQWITASNSYNAGDWVEAELHLGDFGNPVDSLYGIAFDVSYPAYLVESGTENLGYSNSWLGTIGNNVIKLSKINAFGNKFFGALVRTNHIDTSGFGKVATFRFQLRNTIASQTPFTLQITNYTAIKANGEIVALNSFPSTINVNPVSTGFVNERNVSELSIFPNPYSDNTTISYNLKDRAAVNVEVTNAMGQEIQILVSENQSAGNHSYNFSAKSIGLGAGIYFVKITINGQTTMKRIVETK